MSYRLLQGDALDVLETLEAEARATPEMRAAMQELLSLVTGVCRARAQSGIIVLVQSAVSDDDSQGTKEANFPARWFLDAVIIGRSEPATGVWDGSLFSCVRSLE